MGEPLTRHATIPHPATVAEALAELDVSEPRTLDTSRWARVGSEVIPLPFPSADAATAVEIADDTTGDEGGGR